MPTKARPGSPDEWEAVLENEGLLNRIVKHLQTVDLRAKRDWTFDELKSLGFEYMLAAVQNYDESRGIKFGYFAWKTVFQRLTRDVFDRASKTPRDSFDERSTTSSSREEEKSREPGDESLSETSLEETALLHRALDLLDDTEKRVVEEHFFRDKSQREVARLLGCSHTQIQNILKQALSKLRQDLGDRIESR